MRHIHRYRQYTHWSTPPSANNLITAAEAFFKRQGVCQSGLLQQSAVSMCGFLIPKQPVTQMRQPHSGPHIPPLCRGAASHRKGQLVKVSEVHIHGGAVFCDTQPESVPSDSHICAPIVSIERACQDLLAQQCRQWALHQEAFFQRNVL